MHKFFAGVVVVLLAGLAAPSYAAVLPQEPPMGKLRLGQRMLVDDGTCPKGQVLEVIGGDHRKVGGAQMIERRRRCIPR